MAYEASKLIRPNKRQLACKSIVVHSFDIPGASIPVKSDGVPPPMPRLQKGYTG